MGGEIGHPLNVIAKAAGTVSSDSCAPHPQLQDLKNGIVSPAGDTGTGERRHADAYARDARTRARGPGVPRRWRSENVQIVAGHKSSAVSYTHLGHQALGTTAEAERSRETPAYLREVFPCLGCT